MVRLGRGVALRDVVQGRGEEGRAERVRERERESEIYASHNLWVQGFRDIMSAAGRGRRVQCMSAGNAALPGTSMHDARGSRNRVRSQVHGELNNSGG